MLFEPGSCQGGGNMAGQHLEGFVLWEMVSEHQCKGRVGHVP